MSLRSAVLKFKAVAAWFLRALWQYVWNWVDILDRMGNVALFGDPRQSISGRMGRNVEAGRCPFCSWMCRKLDFFERNHCARTWADDQKPLNPDRQTTGV